LIQQNTLTSIGGEMDAIFFLFNGRVQTLTESRQCRWRMSRILKRSFSSELEKIRTQLMLGR